MSIQRVIVCDGKCGAQMVWPGRPTRAVMEQQARDKGWHAPDKLGSHFCMACRRPEGRVQWWRRRNVQLGLPPGYGLYRCLCKDGDPEYLWTACCAAGHPGVTERGSSPV